MTKTRAVFALSLGMLAFWAAAAPAQTWSPAQVEVWTVVIKSYEAIDKRDANWAKDWVFEDAMVWGPGYPMPRGRDSVLRWDAYNFPRGKTLVAEYTPAAIVVHGSTAVAHYYYSNATEASDGEHETTHGRCTDVLAKDGKSWKFIAWHCADEPSDD